MLASFYRQHHRVLSNMKFFPSSSSAVSRNDVRANIAALPLLSWGIYLSRQLCTSTVPTVACFSISPNQPTQRKVTLQPCYYTRSPTCRFSTSPESDHSESLKSFSTTYHAPVMWRECIDALLEARQSRHENDEEGLVFVDGTLGGGGHSNALLNGLQPNDIVIGCDVDADALQEASSRLQKFQEQNPALPTFIPVRSNFCDLVSALAALDHPRADDIRSRGVDGLLLDLGVSSHQIDTAERGFAFMQDGPLDMRMGDTLTLTAADICNQFDAGELQRIMKVYGDEPRAKVIAQSIVDHRPLYSTSDLVKAVAAVTPDFSKKSRRMGRTATLARVFQSLRIVVNEEDTVLEKALLEMAPALLRSGGRLVVLSYHSMEDRAAKRAMRDGTLSRQPLMVERDIFGNPVGDMKPFRMVGKRMKAAKEEIELNSRARSATLRVAERQ